MTLRARTWILLLLASLLVVVAAVAMRSGFTTLANTTSTVSTQLRPASDSIADLAEALAVMDSSATSYALTGNVTDLGSYAEAEANAQAAFDQLQVLLASDEELAQMLVDLRRAQEVWQRQGTRPIIEATRAGDRAGARELVASGTSRNLYNDVRTYTHSLGVQIPDRADEATARQQREFVRLSSILNLSILLFFGLLLVFALLLFFSVLRPLRELQEQLVQVTQAGHHETPITPAGPPELHAVGQDAESMRRELVTEIDRAQQAQEGLAQQTPVVAAIRAELSDSHLEPVPGVDFAGVQKPAEGVLAGDWWSAELLLDGRLAIVVTDVSGHGPEAGMEALRLKHIIELSLAQRADPARAMTLAAEGARTPARFATCVIVVLEPETGLITWANAGHPPAWVVNGSGASELVATGPMISVLGGTWTNRRAQLDPGAVLLMWTDGLAESHDADQQELGDAGLAELVTAALAAEHDAAGIVAHLLAAARARAVDWHRDDVTCVAVRRV